MVVPDNPASKAVKRFFLTARSVNSYMCVDQTSQVAIRNKKSSPE